ncbi:MAG: glycosyltransferase [Dehalococcoidia bacterium]
MADKPDISVVIASVNGPPMIDECLVSLANQKGDVNAEVIVVDVTGEDTVCLIKEKFPWVKLQTFPERRTIPELRAIGLSQSSGDIVAVIEDHCITDERWFEGIVSAHRKHPDCVAVGGVVENDSGARLVDWAVFFCEYSTYMLPLRGGIVGDIPGNNVSYKRRAFEGIDGLEELLNQGFWETTLHDKLRERGDRFLLEPSIAVYHKKHFGFRYTLSQRYHYSRYYAGTLLAGASLPTRAFRSGASLALPLLLMARIGSRVVRKRRHLKKLLLTTPLLAAFTGVWAIGESVGCLFGPGQSLSAVE